MLELILAAAIAAAPAPPLEPLDEPQLLMQTASGTVAMTMEEYVAHVVAAEVPHTFHAEALKAQAIAARTYTAYCIETGARDHGGADVCADAAHCCGYAAEVPAEIAAAVAETEGEILTTGGAPILAMWHASSAGRTASCGEILAEVPYLVSVTTPEAPESARKSFTRIEAAAILAAAGKPWDRRETVEVTLTDSGRCDTLTLGSVTLTGREARSLFGLRSTDFTVHWERGMLTFVTFGYGHGIGMSQRGADAFARDGWDAYEILAHYYSGDVKLGEWE